MLGLGRNHEWLVAPALISPPRNPKAGLHCCNLLSFLLPEPRFYFSHPLAQATGTHYVTRGGLRLSAPSVSTSLKPWDLEGFRYPFHTQPEIVRQFSPTVCALLESSQACRHLT